MVSHQQPVEAKDDSFPVLILIVMDNGLSLLGGGTPAGELKLVLILIVMDNGLSLRAL